MHILENVLPSLDMTFSCNVVDKSVLGSEYANYCPETNELSIREDVYDDACNEVPRHRFTIAHELGHYFMHKDVTTFSRCDNTCKIPAYRDAEWQANFFASTFLMPPNIICNMTISDISKKCGTSRQAAEIALKNSKKSQARLPNSFSF